MQSQAQGLKRGLTARHIRFMALGSAIGTGLFYGSAAAIQMAGPAVLLAYLIGGAAVFMVMRALGEMAVHNPVSGSFGKYASTYLGPMAGFVLGWTYAFEMIIVCLADVTAFGIYMGFWFPEVARWVWVLGIVFLIGGLNLCNVKVFGEMEFWLSLLILLFYVLTLFVLMCLYPWPQIGSQGSPFVQIFSNLGIGSAATVLNIVVISAAVSAINSDIFGAGRMMYGLAEQGHAPKGFSKISRHGVPWMTVLVMGAALLGGVVLNYLIPENVFLLIASIATFATVWVWLMILVTQVAMRRSMSREEVAQLKFPVPFWPYGPAAAIAFMLFVFGVLGYFPDTQAALIVGVVWVVFLVAAYWLWCKPRGTVTQPVSTPQ